MQGLVVRILVVFLIGIFAAPGSQAQRPDSESQVSDSSMPIKTSEVDTVSRLEASWRLERGAKEINFEFGFAPMQPTFFSGRKEYDTSGRKLAMGSFKWGRVIGTARGVT